MKRIGCGLLSFRNVYPLLAAIWFVLKNLVSFVIKAQNKYWEATPLFFTFISFVGEALIGILEIVSLFLRKERTASIRKTSLNSTSNNPVSRFSFIPSKMAKTRKFLTLLPLYLIITLLEGIGHSLNGIMSRRETSHLYFGVRVLNLFFMSFFSKKLLNYDIYPHHIVACVIVAIGVLLVYVFDFQFYYVDCFIYVIDVIGFSMKEVGEKWLMEVKGIRYSQLGFIKGAIGMLFFFIINCFLLLIPKGQEVYFYNENIFQSIALVFSSSTIGLYFFAYLAICFLFQLFSLCTKAHFSPTLMSLAFAFAFIIWMILLLVLQKKERPPNWKLYLLVPGDLLILSGCLLYNEIIILYFCKLEVNTKKEITKRSEEEIGDNDILYVDAGDDNDVDEI